MSCYGGEIETPNLDTLAYNGLRFRNAYNNAKCSPTRASLLTGQYPQKVGCGDLCRVQNETELPGYRGFLDPEYPTIAEVLKSAGYLTMLSGKWHLGGERLEWGKRDQGYKKIRESEKVKWPNERGFDQFFGLIHGSSGTRKAWKTRPYLLNGQIYHTQKHRKAFLATEAFTDFALEFIHAARDTSDAPFFLYMPHTAPHRPLDAPQYIKDKYFFKYQFSKNWKELRENRFKNLKALNIIPEEWKLNDEYENYLFNNGTVALDSIEFRKEILTYGAMLEHLDFQIGRIIKHLKDLGELENTLIIYLADNGPDGRGKGHLYAAPFVGSKTSLREGGTKTHMVMHWPDGIKNPGKIVDQWVHVIDFLPSFVDLVKDKKKKVSVELKKGPGKSFYPFLKKEKESEHEYLFWDLYGEQSVIYKQRWKWYRNVNQEEYLFDLKLDGTETENIIDKHPAIAHKLREKHAEYCKENNVALHQDVLRAIEQNEWHRRHPNK